MNRSIVLIIPYFGKYFNNYFDLWLKSVEGNPSIDFYIYTDNIVYDIPKNVKVINCSFESFLKRFEEKLGHEIKFNQPYKLCDLKPMYGFVLYDDISEYDYWGYCDIDLIFGNIRKYITNEVLERFDKVFPRGHISIMKNEKSHRELFLKEDTWKMVISTNNHYTYDERFNGGVLMSYI